MNESDVDQLKQRAHGALGSLETACRSEMASRHIRQGLRPRFLYIQECLIYIRGAHSPHDHSPKDRIANCHINIYLHYFYICIRGAIDNMAWVAQHIHNVVPDASESRKQSCVNLFPAKSDNDFRKNLKGRNPKYVEILDKFDPWLKEICDFRNPIAHQIPIYSPPSVVPDTDQKKWMDANNQLSQIDYAQSPDLYMNKLRERSSIGKYIPLIVVSQSNHMEIYKLRDCTERDAMQFWSFALEFVTALVASCNDSSTASDGDSES
ncbi:hypothetical protein [Ruficoccus sp. ZRK36]|uniref:hypothetical protein n=1 Tax=Ruficoccus sp. ZRK36 TaxID=2866311 RepID=UPI001C73061A|nr:hypothetical protein [Ruficoccus sp. ZRK36]QYY34606.1 hypothetical protein K0V07_09855 [Ruficoccus sp. ZRK36]